MDSHPIADLLPLMHGHEYQALVDDIRQHGLRHPILVYDGQILDGRNRYRACLDAGVEPETTTFEGTHREAMQVARSENIPRRHLDAAQRAAAWKLWEQEDASWAREYTAQAEAEAKARQGTRTDLSQSPDLCSTASDRPGSYAAYCRQTRHRGRHQPPIYGRHGYHLCQEA